MIKLFVNRPVVFTDYLVFPEKLDPVKKISLLPKMLYLQTLAKAVRRVSIKAYLNQQIDATEVDDLAFVIIAMMMMCHEYSRGSYLKCLRQSTQDILNSLKTNTLHDAILELTGYNSLRELLEEYDKICKKKIYVIPMPLSRFLVADEHLKELREELKTAIVRKYGLKALEELEREEDKIMQAEEVVQAQQTQTQAPSHQQIQQSSQASSQHNIQKAGQVSSQQQSQQSKNTKSGQNHTELLTPTTQTQSAQFSSSSSLESQEACPEASAESAEAETASSGIEGKPNVSEIAEEQQAVQVQDSLEDVFGELTATAEQIIDQFTNLDYYAEQYITNQNPQAGEKIYEALQNSMKAGEFLQKLYNYSIKNAIQRRLERRLEKHKAEGTWSQGLTGYAGILLNFSDMLEEAEEIELEQILYRKLRTKIRESGLLKKLKATLTWLRKDYRTNLFPGPYVRRYGQKVRIAVGVDVSGSVSSAELLAFLKSLRRLLESEKLRVEGDIFFWSTVIEDEVKLDEVEDLTKVPSGGGTNPNVFFNRVKQREEEEKKKYDAIVLLSDGVWGIEGPLKEALEWTRAEHKLALAVITADKDTARKLQELGWEVIYHPIIETEEE